MKRLNHLHDFLSRAIGLPIKVTPYASNLLPPLFARYELAKVEFGDKASFLALIDKQQFPTRVKQAIGQAQWAGNTLGIHAVYVAPHMDRLMRFRMREKQAEFIDLSSEIYMPSLGRIARESVREPKPISDKPGFPAQRIVLAKLNHLLAEPITADSLRKQFGYSSVTIIAALKELELQGIIRRESLPNSRKQSITFTTTGHALWNKISPLLTNPISERIAVDTLPDSFARISGGETALSDISMLNPPEQETIAFYGTAAERKKLKDQQVVLDDGKYIIEFWRYPPLLPGRASIDPLSTILVTRDIANDERVAGEHEEILENFKW